jgi:5S rRNA maturation endonuclease (ribonuclease M5)
METGNNFNIQNFLEENGYPIMLGTNYVQTAGLWREGDNKTAICIYPKDDLVCDFVTGEKYNISTLIGKILGIEDKNKLKEYLEQTGVEIDNAPKEIQSPIIKSIKVLNKDFISKLDRSDKSQEYWLKRGISLNILKEFQGGVYKNRYYFPIYNPENQLIGWQYRNLLPNCEKRYLIRGEKKSFVYPVFACSKDIIDSKKVYLHEGIPDTLSLMSVGIRNNLVLFGTEISFAIINYLLRIPDITIIICQNNDDAGRDSSIKIRKKLLKYFDWSQVFIKEVRGKNKDLNDLLVNESPEKLKEWCLNT